MRWDACKSIAAGVLLVLLAGCAGASPEAGSGASTAAGAFSGPWAEEFSSYYQHTENEFVRTVLSDGEISELEYAEVWDRFRTCLGGYGIELGEVKQDGSYQTTFPESLSVDVANTTTQQCSYDSG